MKRYLFLLLSFIRMASMQAQNTDSTELEAIKMDEVVISATRWSQKTSQIPSKVSVLTPRQMALLQPQTAADMLGAGGEVFIQKSQQGGGSPMIRGFATNRLLYSVDGVRMNTAIFRAGNLQNVISLDPYAIEKTEVFFGPGSVIYGSDAIGGVMSFATLTPQFVSDERKLLVKTQAASRYSSANQEFTNHFDTQIGGRKWASTTSLTYARYGDLMMGKYGPDSYLNPYQVIRLNDKDSVLQAADGRIQSPTGYNQLNLMQKLRWAPAAGWDVQYGFHYSKTSEYSRYDRLLERQANGLPVHAVWNYGPQLWVMHHLSAKYEAKNRWFDGVAMRLAHQTFEESRIDRRLNQSRLRTQVERVAAISANLDFEKLLNKHHLYYGLEYIMNDVKSKGSAVDISVDTAIATPDRYPAAQWQSYAAYLNYQYAVSERCLVQAGARYSGFSIDADFTRLLDFYPFNFKETSLRKGATTGSIGLVFRPDQSWKISVNGSTGFRAPNVDDMGKLFDFATGEVVVPNPKLQAEYAWNAEFGITKIVSDWLKIDLSGYYTWLNNAMVRRSFQVNGQDSILYDGAMARVYAIQNAASATVYGINAGVEARFLKDFSFVSQLNYQLGKEELDNGETSRSRHAAPTFGNTRLQWNHDHLTLQLALNYCAAVSYTNLNEEERQKPFIYAQDAEGKPYSPSWYTLNLKALYQLSEHWSLSAGVENITDQRYRPYSSGLVAAGRNFIISARAKF